MKGKILTVALICLITTGTWAQTEMNLINLAEPIEGFNRQGTLSVYRMGKNMTPRIMVTPSVDGVVIKTNYTLYKFGTDYRKLWQVELPKTMKLGDMPEMRIVSDEEGTYVYEVRKNVVQFAGASGITSKPPSIIHISPEGKITHQEYDIDLSEFYDYDVFILQGNFYLLAKGIDRKAKRTVYTLYSINKNNHKLSIRKINLPGDEYEHDQAKFSKDYYWYPIGTSNGEAVLVKSYFKNVKGSKAKSLAIQLLRMNGEGAVSHSQELYFEPSLAEEDRLFVLPTITYNPKDNSVLLTGFMEIDKRKINGLYLLKYDLETGALTYKHEHAFKDILKPAIKPIMKAHYEIPERVHSFYPLKIRLADLVQDYVNDFVMLRIVTDFDLNSISFFEVKFDRYGDHVQTDMAEYRQAIQLIDNVIPTPTKHQQVWKDKTRTHVVQSKPGVWDYINSKASIDNKKEEIFWVPVTTPTSNGVIRFDQKNGKFFGISLN
jgi:hypothetical protein